jgi:hypothetical protein
VRTLADAPPSASRIRAKVSDVAALKPAFAALVAATHPRKGVVINDRSSGDWA